MFETFLSVKDQIDIQVHFDANSITLVLAKTILVNCIIIKQSFH
jgi:hypothetical protein